MNTFVDRDGDEYDLDGLSAIASDTLFGIVKRFATICEEIEAEGDGIVWSWRRKKAVEFRKEYIKELASLKVLDPEHHDTVFHIATDLFWRLRKGHEKIEGEIKYVS